MNKSSVPGIPAVQLHSLQAKELAREITSKVTESNPFPPPHGPNGQPFQYFNLPTEQKQKNINNMYLIESQAFSAGGNKTRKHPGST